MLAKELGEWKFAGRSFCDELFSVAVYWAIAVVDGFVDIATSSCSHIHLALCLQCVVHAVGRG